MEERRKKILCSSNKKSIVFVFITQNYSHFYSLVHTLIQLINHPYFDHFLQRRCINAKFSVLCESTNTSVWRYAHRNTRAVAALLRARAVHRTRPAQLVGGWMSEWMDE